MGLTEKKLQQTKEGKSTPIACKFGVGKNILQHEEEIEKLLTSMHHMHDYEYYKIKTNMEKQTMFWVGKNIYIWCIIIVWCVIYI